MENQKFILKFWVYPLLYKPVIYNWITYKWKLLLSFFFFVNKKMIQTKETLFIEYISLLSVQFRLWRSLSVQFIRKTFSSFVTFVSPTVTVKSVPTIRDKVVDVNLLSQSVKEVSWNMYSVVFNHFRFKVEVRGTQ